MTAILPAAPARVSRLDDWPAEAVAEAVLLRGCPADVVIPARDEAATIGEIVAAIRRLPAGLVRELVVVDSGSLDGTASVAAAAGARVVALSDVLPAHAPRPGKGEAMWRGLAATSAPLVVFVDGDLVDFDARLVAALVGPLLADPALAMVKGCYERVPSDPARPQSGGGRVTELMARPLIGAFWPALAGVLQPLGGEYSARRGLLERLPFRCGYGVELGLLVDTLRLAGAEAIGQVDLGVRVHRNSDLAALGRMAAEVLHTALDRLVAEGRIDDLERSAVLSQPVRIGEGSVHDLIGVDVAERPPLRSSAAGLTDQGEGRQVATT
jgi:glucosyl-3-phosphoglycerate synthase